MSIDTRFRSVLRQYSRPSWHAKDLLSLLRCLFLTVCAVIGGAEGYQEDEGFPARFIFPGFNPGTV